MSQQWIYTIVYLAWLAGAACFVLGLHRMNSPATGRSGNQLSAAGMVIAVGATFIYSGLVTFLILAVLKYTIGIRVDAEVEVEGLDINLHGEIVHG